MSRPLTMPAINWGAPPSPTVASLQDGPLTEAGFAERLAAAHADHWRWDHTRGRWLVWREHRWAPDADGAVIRDALDTIRRWQRLAVEKIADVQRRSDVLDALFGLERKAKLDAVLALTRHLHPIADAGEWDANPWLLGCPNGVVDLRTGELRDGRPEDRITQQTRVPFDPKATCPRWTQAQREWFPDPDLADFIWRAAGYSITGLTTEQMLVGGYAVGSNGKTTFVRGIAHALGDYAYDMPFSTVEANQRAAIPNDLAALVARRFVLASETNDGTRLNEARIKSLTGGDACTARFLHGEYFTFQPTGKFWLMFNHKPTVRDDSFGFWRRVRLVPFVNQFQLDPALGETFRREAPGILAWLVRGCLAWQERGLPVPDIVAEATGEYRKDSDPFGQFIDEATEPVDGAVVSGSDLFQHYLTWAQRQGFGPREQMTTTMFGRKCGERLEGVRTSAGKVYHGLARRDLV